jgi:hypothetical protein
VTDAPLAEEECLHVHPSFSLSISCMYIHMPMLTRDYCNYLQVGYNAPDKLYLNLQFSRQGLPNSTDSQLEVIPTPFIGIEVNKMTLTTFAPLKSCLLIRIIPVTIICPPFFWILMLILPLSALHW